MTRFGDRYVVEDEIGAGGMAIVYRATDAKHDRPVALKVMRPEIAAAVSRERFVREISIAARLQHPHILTLIDSGEVDGELYYVTPYLEGETLAQRIQREGKLPVGDALRISMEVASALRYAHERGILHRDVKPANIMLTGGHAVVMDFGIAMAMGNPESRLTGTGMIVGTPAYMSPETIGGNPDARSDIYAVGCVMYEMLAGSPPFSGPTAQSILLSHLAQMPRPLADSRRDIPQRLELAVMRALSKKPEDRFDSMAALQAGLEEAVSGAAVEVVNSGGQPSANLQAYDAYLRGIHSYSKRSEKANARAIKLLEEATTLDPNFAAAHAALGSAYTEQFFSFDPDEEWEEKAFAAIEKARALNPRLAKVYVAKGNLLWTRARRFPHAQAIAEYKRALAIDPELIDAMNELGRVYFHIGKLDEAASLYDRALEIDPSYINARFRAGSVEMLRGNYEKALEYMAQVPRGSLVPSVQVCSAMSLHRMGRIEEGRALLAEVSGAHHDDPDLASVRAVYNALDGKFDEAEENIALAIKTGSELGHFHHVENNIVCARALMGQVEPAIAGLKRVSEDGFPCYEWFERDPCLHTLRGDARFGELMKELRRKWEQLS